MKHTSVKFAIISPICALKCLTNSTPSSCLFQNLMWPSQLAVIRNSVLQNTGPYMSPIQYKRMHETTAQKKIKGLMNYLHNRQL